MLSILFILICSSSVPFIQPTHFIAAAIFPPVSWTYLCCRSLDQRSQEKTPKKTHKAEREKLKRDQLNELFLELGSMLG